MASREIQVPDLGSFKDVTIIDVLVKPGDHVDVDTPLLTLETEKATMDVPASAAGIVERLLVQKGGTVSTGTAVVVLAVDPSATGSATKGAAGVTPTSAATTAIVAPGVALPAPAASFNEAGFAAAHASPGVRRFARELGVDLTRLKGTGPKGRILEPDVRQYVKSVLIGRAAGSAAGGEAGGGGGSPGLGSVLPRVPAPDFAQFGAVEVKPLGRIKRISGARLQASWLNLPHVTQFGSADITDLEAERAKLKDRAAAQGVKLTPLAFVLRAVVHALQKFPNFNASLDAAGDNLVYKKYLHLGFAADTPNGLLVPVIREADKKDIYEIARCLGALSEKARAGKLSAAEMQGGCFTVSSLGGLGGTAFTPIINAPELAILGVSRASMQPVYVDGVFVPRLMLPLSLSYDHRVIDGADGARFITALVAALADVARLTEAVP